MQLEKSLLHVLRYYRLHKLFSIACEKIWKLHNMIVTTLKCCKSHSPTTMMCVVVLTAKCFMQMPTVALRRPVYSSDALKIFKTAFEVLSVGSCNISKCGLSSVISILLLSSDHWNCGVGSPSNVKLM